MAASFSVKAIISAVDQFSDPMRKIAGKSLGDISRKASSAGKAMTVGLTLPLIGMGTAAIVSATNLNESMANVSTLIPGATDRVNELKMEVQDLAIETGKSTDDLAGGLYQVISAFGDTTDTATTLGVAARAATAGLSTTEESINLLSAVTKGYGDTSADAVQKVSDLSFVAVKLGQTSFPELAASIGRVVPLSAELGVSQEELYAVMATATGVTGKAADVSTQLRGTLQSILAPTADMANLIKGMGVESGKALLQQKGLKGTIDLITKAAELTGTPLQKFIGSIEGQTLALALSGAQSENYIDKLAAMQTAAGATDEAFNEQTQGINKAGFTMGQLNQKVTVISQRLGDGLAPVLGIVLDKLSPLIDIALDLASGFAELDPGFQTVIVGVTGLAAVMGPVLVTVGALIPLVAGLTLPIVGTVAAVAALTAAGVAFYAKWDDIKSSVGLWWDSIVGKFKSGVANISGFMDSIMSKIDGFTSGIKAVGNFLGFGGGNPSPSGNAASGVKGASASTALSALPTQSPNNQVNGEIKVSFDNAPPGTRIKQAQTNKSGLDVITDLGTNMLNWATGG